jgi:hypothetical protein
MTERSVEAASLSIDEPALEDTTAWALLKERISEFPVARLERTMSGKAPSLLPPSSSDCSD